MSIWSHWFHNHIERNWYNKRKPCFLWFIVWRPFERLYLWVTQRRRIKQEQTQTPFTVPVVIIGNITVGGTGKTPLIIHLIEQLKAQGIQPAVVSRGYGGLASKAEQALLVTAQTQPNEAGDEPCLIAQRTGVPVCVHADRNLAVNTVLAAHPNCQVILSDDGLQHYRLHRDIEVVVVDGQRRFGNMHCLPAGPLREPMQRLDEVDFVVVNGQSPDWYTMHVTGDRLYALNDKSRTLSLKRLEAQPVHVVTGIGNPQRFIDVLEAVGARCQLHLFADHYPFQKSDLCFEDDLPIIMTEKDAVKCQSFQLENAWYLAVDAKPSPAFTQAFLQRVQELIQ